jgi:hypothetical protein
MMNWLVSDQHQTKRHKKRKRSVFGGRIPESMLKEPLAPIFFAHMALIRSGIAIPGLVCHWGVIAAKIPLYVVPESRPSLTWQGER